MSRFNIGNFAPLEGKVIVLTGGALGIGADLVRTCHAAGAHVFFGDVLQQAGEALLEELNAAAPFHKQHLRFILTDVTNYQANLQLFDTALNACGRVDHAVAVAGIGERGNIVSPSLTLATEPKEEMKVLDVDLKAMIFFSRIASVYLRYETGRAEHTTISHEDKSLTLVSSVAGFTETPGLFVYSTAKHGVYGLMRALRKPLIKSSPNPIRTNCICPWMTETRMAEGVQDDWHKAGLPRNKPVDVARVIAGTMADGSINGAGLFVEGGRAWDMEEGIDRTQAQWMGSEQSRLFNIGQEVLGMGEGWTSKQQREVQTED